MYVDEPNMSEDHKAKKSKPNTTEGEKGKVQRDYAHISFQIICCLFFFIAFYFFLLFIFFAFLHFDLY